MVIFDRLTILVPKVLSITKQWTLIPKTNFLRHMFERSDTETKYIMFLSYYLNQRSYPKYKIQQKQQVTGTHQAVRRTRDPSVE